MVGGGEKGQRQWGCRNPPSILRSHCGRGKPTAVLGLMERKSLFACADRDILHCVTQGAGGEHKPGEKILACNGVRKKPTACFDVISSTSSNFTHVNRGLDFFS